MYNKKEYVKIIGETEFRYFTEVNEDGEIILFVQNRANRPEMWYTWSEPQELGELFSVTMSDIMQPEIILPTENEMLCETLGDVSEW